MGSNKKRKQMLAHKGKLKIRPVKAHVKREGIIDKVKPFLKVSINNGHDEWKSDHKHGHNPEWGHEGHWDHHIHHLEHEIEIHLMDHENHHGNEAIGHWKEEAKHFCHKEGEHDMEIEFKHMGHVAGTCHLKIHFEKD